MLHTALCAAGALLSLLATPFAQDEGSGEEVAFERLGRAFQAAHCPRGAEASPCSLDELLAARYARLDLGAYEIAWPTDMLGEPGAADDLARIARGLVDLQGAWIAWLDPASERMAAEREDVALLAEWIEGWKPKVLAGAAKVLDLAALLEAGPEVRAASGRLAKALMDPEKLGFAPRTPGTVRMLFCPTRRDFMELLGFAGLEDPKFQKENWVEGADQWTQFWCDWTLVIAVEYAPWTGFDPEFKTGLEMEKFSETGTIEHVCQQAALAMLWRAWEHPDPRFVDKGLAMNLVIDVCGSINTLDGSQGAISNSGAATAPYSRFVPGGNPNGGTLPPIPAGPLDHLVDNQWRRDHGATRFLEPLKKGQKEGAKESGKQKLAHAKDKLAHFLLRDPNAGEHVVSAPFFGPHVAEKQYPPAEFMNDYREFFRAYQASFLNFLEEHGVPDSPEESAARFQDLLRQLGTETGFDQAVTEVYGVPISAADGTSDSLEWRFLAWVDEAKVDAKGKAKGKKAKSR
jgi:hypothetical protein